MMNRYSRVLPLVMTTLLALGAFFGGLSAAWAHGGEDHSTDTPPSPAAEVPALLAQNKLVLSSDAVELVALADPQGLQIYLDRFDTNQPIANANLSVELNGEEYTAEEIQPGLYRVESTKLTAPGSYELLFTIDSESISDLLEGTLQIQPQAAAATTQIPAQSTTGVGGFPLLDTWQISVFGITLVVVLLILFRVRSSRSAAATATVFALVLIGSPDRAMAHGGEDHSTDSQPNTYATATLPNAEKARRFPSGEVYLPKPNQRMLSIHTRVGKLESVPTIHQLTAHVLASPNHSGQVQAAQDGRVDTSRVPLPHLGQWVEQGELVGHILPVAERFEQGNQQAQQAELSSALRLAETRYARLVKLKGSVPKKDIDEARSEVVGLKSRLAAVVKSLRGREPLYAPISGYITAVNITPGQIVESRDTLLEIVDPSRMQVEALAYDRQTTLLERAYSVNRSADHLDLRLLGVGVNLKGHAIPMLFEVVADNPPLAIGEALTVYVTGKNRTQGIVLPRASLVKGSQGEDLVWVHSAAERFMPKAVRWSVVDKDHIAVTDGLNDGERVVIQGATLLSQIR